MWQAAQQYLDPNKHTLVEVAIYNTTAIKFYAGIGILQSGQAHV